MLASIVWDLQLGMWMVSLDLKDALHVPKAAPPRRFLRFVLIGRHRHLSMGGPSFRVGHDS